MRIVESNIRKKYNYAPYSPSVRAGLRTFVLGVIFRSSMSMARLVGGMTERAGKPSVRNRDSRTDCADR